VENEKSFFQDLYKGLEAEENDNPTRGIEGFFLAPSSPPPPGGAENRVQDEFTYIDSPRGYFPQKTPEALIVGGSISPPVVSRCMCKRLCTGGIPLLKHLL
jgi:hypothetical protein